MDADTLIINKGARPKRRSALINSLCRVDEHYLRERMTGAEALPIHFPYEEKMDPRFNLGGVFSLWGIS
jgi:hypothetical protein